MACVNASILGTGTEGTESLPAIVVHGTSKLDDSVIPTTGEDPYIIVATSTATHRVQCP